jgi:hypothetical protein
LEAVVVVVFEMELNAEITLLAVPKETMRMSEIILEIMQRHATGIRFKERNAGTQIDAKMQAEVRFFFFFFFF